MSLTKGKAAISKTKSKALLKATGTTTIMKTQIIMARFNYLPHLLYSPETKLSLKSTDHLITKKLLV